MASLMLAMPRRLPPAVKPDPPDAARRPVDVAKDAPLRLSVAAEIAFPFRGMTAAGLRKEAARGNLAIERIAGKDYTTLGAIEAMRERCRKEAKASAGPAPRETQRAVPSGPSADADIALAAAKMSIERLKAGFDPHGSDGARSRLVAQRQRDPK
jgi:hypothetical protein